MKITIVWDLGKRGNLHGNSNFKTCSESPQNSSAVKHDLIKKGLCNQEIAEYKLRLLFLFLCSENRLVHKGLQNRPIPHEILRVLTFWVIKTDKRLCLAFSLLCASGSLSKRASFFNGTWRWSSLEWEGTTSNSRMLIRISLWLKWLGPWNPVSGTLSSQGFS